MAEVESNEIATIQLGVNPNAAPSDGERRLDPLRRRFGFFAAPAIFLAIWLTPFESLTQQAHRLAAIMAAVVVLWITEALPIPVSALIGATLCVILRVAPAKEVFAPFADPLMFLFIGSFMIARAIFFHRLDRRVAFGVLSLRWVGARPGRMLFAFGAVTCFMSAWIPNTPVTAMMFPIALSIVAFLFDSDDPKSPTISRRFATGLMLMTSFGASVGGLATPVGTAPNLIGLGYIRKELGVELPFFKWALIGVPVVVVLFVYLFWYLHFLCPARVREIPGAHEMLDREKRSLGRWTAGQISTAFAFLLTVALWIVPGTVGLLAGDHSPEYLFVNSVMPESVAAMIGALLLFMLPGDRGQRALTWEEAVKIDWGVVLLFGGGVALGVLASQTGLAQAMGHGLTEWIPLEGSLGFLVTSTLIAALVSEGTSNTASANIVIPVVIAIAKAAEMDPLEPALGATFGCSLGFMLPVSTPCNAIVYGSGYVPLGLMMRYGILLDIAGVIVIVTLIRVLLPLVR
jgi:sodium-dependent dicarboxylate transporter 2/3/5